VSTFRFTASACGLSASRALAENVATASDALSQQADALNRSVDTFLGGLRDAA